MRKYEKPNINIKEIDIEDILSASGFDFEDVHDVGNKDNVFDEIF